MSRDTHFTQYISLTVSRLVGSQRPQDAERATYTDTSAIGSNHLSSEVDWVGPKEGVDTPNIVLIATADLCEVISDMILCACGQSLLTFKLRHACLKQSHTQVGRVNGSIMMGFSPSVRTHGGLGRPVGGGLAVVVVLAGVVAVSAASAAMGLHAAPATSRASGRNSNRMIEVFDCLM